MQAPVAERFVSRFFGLMGRRDLSDAFLFIPRCSSIHTCFMRGAIDIVFLDRENRALRIVESMQPWRFAWGPRGTDAVLETPAGYTRSRRIAEGDVILCR